MPRLAFIHALPESMAPLNAELERQWPECERMHLLDDSLSADLARSPHGLDATMTGRFLRLTAYARSTGAGGILFSCSAFGPCIEAVALAHRDIPVLKPNEALVDDAVRAGRRIGLVATFAPTLRSMAPEFPAGTDLRTAWAEGALEALRAGNEQGHDTLIAEAAARLAAEGCDVIALAQFSMARSAPHVARVVACPVLTSVSSAVARLRSRVEGG